MQLEAIFEWRLQLILESSSGWQEMFIRAIERKEVKLHEMNYFIVQMCSLEDPSGDHYSLVCVIF